MAHPSPPGAHLVSPTPSRLRTLLSWFDSEASVALWGGPVMRWPMTLESLIADASVEKLASYFLMSDSDVLAFGQFYARLDRCHLGRLVVAPEHRGRRYGEWLINQLSTVGRRALQCDSDSLFVLTHNHSAIALYQRMGFEPRRYPLDDVDLSGMVYMVRERSGLAAN